MASPETKIKQMREVSYAFIQAFAAGRDGPELLDRFFVRDTPGTGTTSSSSSNTSNNRRPMITEHGPEAARTRLPFLAKTFRGRNTNPPIDHADHKKDSDGEETCDDYYTHLTHTLAFTLGSVDFPSHPGDLPCGVDPDTVTVKMRGRFKSVKMGLGWWEDFIYVLSDFTFGEDGECRIGRQEVWADVLSAWESVGP